LLGALYDLFEDPSVPRRIIESAGFSDIQIKIESGEKSHISGTRIAVLVNGREESPDHTGSSHECRTLSDVMGIIDSLNVSDSVKENAKSIYRDIAEAESMVHARPVSEVHFHEVGMMDAIADIVCNCMLIEELSPDRIISSPLRTGYGHVRCSHGLLPIPAPATAIISTGIPTYAGEVEGEFTTPTGAAIVKHFAQGYSQRPRMTIGAIGVGIGSRDYDIPNILRCFIGEAVDVLYEIYELNCNIDDMTPEDLAPVIDILLENGALDAIISPVVMKKGRPGYRLTCLCRQEDKDRLAKIILSDTSTIGLRIWKADRYEMTSSFDTYRTEYGDVRIKVSEGYGLVKWKPEHDDLVRLAAENGVSVKVVRDSVRYVPKR